MPLPNEAIMQVIAAHETAPWTFSQVIVAALRELMVLRAPCEACRTNPTRKVGEEKHGMGHRHNLTAELCEACFRKLMGDAAVSAADDFDRSTS